MSRKTIPVETLKTQVNNILMNTDDDYKQGRECVIALIEDVLMKSGNYKGFQYLTSDDMAKSTNGVSVGINEGTNDKFVDTDQTRVKYF